MCRTSDMVDRGLVAGRAVAQRRQARVTVLLVSAAAVVSLLFDLGPRLWPGTHAIASRLDDVAHISTTALLLMALKPSRRFWASALVAAVAIDLDHVPQDLGWGGWTQGAVRPYSHSLITVCVALALALASSRARDVGLGAACGFAVHLWRDAVTGPGIPLVWPLSTAAVRLPYAAYAGSIALVTAMTIRSMSTSRNSWWTGSPRRRARSRRAPG